MLQAMGYVQGILLRREFSILMLSKRFELFNFVFLVAELRERHFCSSLNHYATYTGCTPLHYAVILDNEDIIQLLLDNGKIHLY